VPSLLLRDKRDFAANGALIIRGALDEAEPPQLVIQREMMRRIAWTGVQAAEAINPSGFLRARRKRPRRRAALARHPGRAIDGFDLDGTAARSAITDVEDLRPQSHGRNCGNRSHCVPTIAFQQLFAFLVLVIWTRGSNLAHWSLLQL
jgi:hypothetical protein